MTSKFILLSNSSNYLKNRLFKTIVYRRKGKYSERFHFFIFKLKTEFVGFKNIVMFFLNYDHYEFVCNVFD